MILRKKIALALVGVTTAYLVGGDAYAQVIPSSVHVKGSADVEGALHVKGAADFKGAITTEGNAIINGLVTAKGSGDFRGNLTAAGKGIFRGGLVVENSANITGTVTAQELDASKGKVKAQEVLSATVTATEGFFTDKVTADKGHFISKVVTRDGFFTGSVHAAGDIFSTRVDADEINANRGVFHEGMASTDGLFSGTVSSDTVWANRGLFSEGVRAKDGVFDDSVSSEQGRFSTVAVDKMLVAEDATLKSVRTGSLTANKAATFNDSVNINGKLVGGEADFHTIKTKKMDVDGRLSVTQDAKFKTNVTVGEQLSAREGTFSEKVKTKEVAADTVTADGVIANAVVSNSVTANKGAFADEVTSVQGVFTEKVSSKDGVFSNEVTAAQGSFTENVSSKAGVFSESVASKKGVFSDHVTSRKGAFSDSVTSKRGEFESYVRAQDGIFANTMTTTLQTRKLDVEGNSSFKGDSEFEGKITGTDASFSGKVKAKELAAQAGEFTSYVRAKAGLFANTMTTTLQTRKLDVEGNSSFKGDSEFKGKITGTNATFSGNVKAKELESESLVVKGNAKVRRLDVAESAIVGQDLTVKGNATVQNSLTVEKNIEAKGVITGKVIEAKEQVKTKDLKATTGNIETLTSQSATTMKLVVQDKAEIDKLTANKGLIKELKADTIWFGENHAKNVETEFNAVNKRVDILDEKVNSAGALGAALSALKPMPFDVEGTQILAAVGRYQGTTAYALGLAHYQSENVMFHGGLSYDGKESVMGNLGVSFKVGKGSSKKSTPANVLPANIVKKLAKQEQEIKAQNERLAAQQAQLKELEKTIRQLMKRA